MRIPPMTMPRAELSIERGRESISGNRSFQTLDEEIDSRPLQRLARNVKPLQIGSLVVDPPLLQAPMAGFTNFAYRQVVREFGGVGLQATEMVSARAFVWMDQREQEAPDRLWGVADEPRPLAVQMWDNDPETLAAVGRDWQTNTRLTWSISTSAAR